MSDALPGDGVTLHRLTLCPTCGATINAAGTFDGAPGAPAPGDWTVCAKCLAWLVYLEGLTLRPVTPAEWDALTPAERGTLDGQRERVRRAWAR